MPEAEDEDQLLRSVALQNAKSISAARLRGEQELISAQTALRESEERLRAIIDQAAVGMAVCAMDGKFEQVNQRFVDLVGFGPSELRQRTFIDITHPDDLARSQAYKQRLIAGELTDYAYEKRFIRKDGSSIWCFTTVTLLKDSLGRAKRFIGVIEDISARKQAEEALRQSEQFNRSIIESSRDCIQILDLQGNLRVMPAGSQELLGGVNPANHLDKPWEQLWPTEDRAAARAAVNRAAAGGTGNFVGCFGSVSTSAKWWDVVITPMLNAKSEPERLLAVWRDVTERRKAEEALQVRERELSLIYGNVSDVVFYVAVEGKGERGRDFRFVSVNPAFLAATGLTEDRVVGRGVDEVIPEPSRSKVLENYARAMAERRTVRWEESSLYPAGTKVGLVSVTPIFDAAGACINLIGTVHDITDRKREEEVRTRLAAVVQSSDDAIISKTLDGIITTWNEGAQRMMGYTAEEVIGKSVTILMPPDRVSEEGRIQEKLRKGEPIEHYETVRQRKDGTLLDVSLTVSPIRDSTGKVIGASKIARDVTERKRTQRALEDETRILELLNITGAAIASQLDMHALLQTVTDAATALSGAQFGAFFYNSKDEQGEAYLLYTLSGAPREKFDNFGHPRPTPLFGPTFNGESVIRIADVLQDPRYGKWGPHYGMPPNHLPVRSYLAVSVVGRSGEVIGGLFFGHPEPGMFTERTERLIAGVAAQAAVAIDNARLYEDVRSAAKEREVLLEAERAARAEAERASVMKDEFLATLSHELRTPLNAILGWSQILRSRTHADEEVEEGLEVIERNTRVQTQLIEDLLDMSRIISGKIRLDVQRVDLQDVVKAAVASVRHTADVKDIQLQVVLDPLAGPVRGDPGRLQQCFWNLLTNAIKFTPKGGKVRVSLERVNSHLEVCIADNGEGIKPEFLPHLFERFRQADASTTRRHGGLGIGLSIVKNLVEMHGGTVRATSEGIGKGSTMCIDLPLMAVRAMEAEQPREHPTSPMHHSAPAMPGDHPSLEGITVLAVDDEEDARKLLKRVLEDCGARVLLANSSREGLAIVKSARPDMIISDIGMPDEDGYDFIRQVRKLEANEGGRTPAAALTAFARAEDRTRALRAGYQTHIAKPVEATELTAVVASLATRK